MARISYTDKELIEMIKRSESTRHKALSWICQEDAWVKGSYKASSNAGLRDEHYEDVFQEALTAMTFNVLKDRFREDSQLRTYFISICRNLSLKWANKQKSHEPLDNVHHLSFNPIGGDDHKDELELKKLMKSAFEGLKEGCRRILMLYGTGLSMEEIALEMGYENKQSAKNKSKACRDKLKVIIESNVSLHSRLKEWI